MKLSLILVACFVVVFGCGQKSKKEVVAAVKDTTVVVAKDSSKAKVADVTKVVDTSKVKKEIVKDTVKAAVKK